MPVFGFAVDYANGATDCVVALGDNIEQAHAAVRERFVHTDCDVSPLHLEDMLGDQYDCVAILSSEDSAPPPREDMGDLFLAEEARLLEQNRR